MKGKIEFVLPDDFDDKPGFVYYEAELMNLQMSFFQNSVSFVKALD